MLSFGKGAGKPVAVRGNSGISSPTRPLNKSANAKRLLIVTLVEARDLVAVNTSDATSDPYVTLSLAINDVDIREEKMHMSSIKKRTIHPEYNETFTFGKKKNVQ